MGTAFIVIDPRRKYSNLGIALNRLNELRSFLEMNLVVLPRIKNLSKKYNVRIVSPEDAATKDLAKKRGISFVERNIPEQNTDHAFEQTVKLSKE